MESNQYHYISTRIFFPLEVIEYLKIHTAVLHAFISLYTDQ